MFNHIKNSYLDENIFKPASEEAMNHIIDSDDILKEEFDCEESYPEDTLECLINSIPDSICDSDEFDTKLNDIIDSIPEYDKESSIFEQLELL